MVVLSSARRPFWQGAVAALVLCTLGTTGAHAEEISATGVETSITLFPHLVNGLGLELGDRPGSAAEELRFTAEGPWAVNVATKAIHFGPLQHREGLAVSWDGKSVWIEQLRFRPAPRETQLEVLDNAGDVLFLVDHIDVKLDPEFPRLTLGPADLRLGDDLAERLGSSGLAGTAVGRVKIQAVATVRQDCIVPDFDLPKDALMIDIEEVQQTIREAGSKVAITPSVSLLNIGEADIEWYGPFSGQHPYLAWTLYRISEDGIRQLGLSDVKHGYLSVNTDCPCNPGPVFWVGCSDTYSVTSNENQYYLGPRDEIEAHTGLWEECGSHFDGLPVDCQRDDPGLHDPWDHRLIVQESDLLLGVADYYFEAFYIIKNDLNIFNTMAHLRVQPSLQGDTWVFPAAGSLVLGPAVDAWVAPTGPPPGSANHKLDTGEGHVQLAVQTEDLGSGLYRYTYALMNHDFDRQVGAFEVPLAPGGTVQSTSFTDLDSWLGNDWLAAVTSHGTLRWQAPNPDSALDWGTLFGFVFEADMVPLESQARLGVEEAGGPSALYIQTLAGAGSPFIFQDGFESGDASQWSASTSH